MKTVQVTDRTKQKLEQMAQRQGRPVHDIVDELVSSLLPNGRRSAKGILEGKVGHLLEDADFEGLHRDILELYGPDAE